MTTIIFLLALAGLGAGSPVPLPAEAPTRAEAMGSAERPRLGAPDERRPTVILRGARVVAGDPPEGDESVVALP